MGVLVKEVEANDGEKTIEQIDLSDIASGLYMGSL